MSLLPRRGPLGHVPPGLPREVGRRRSVALRPLVEGLEGRTLLSVGTVINSPGGSASYSVADQVISLSARVTAYAPTTSGQVCRGAK